LVIWFKKQKPLSKENVSKCKIVVCRMIHGISQEILANKRGGKVCVAVGGEQQTVNGTRVGERRERDRKVTGKNGTSILVKEREDIK
jgi:hypothetical protein